MKIIVPIVENKIKGLHSPYGKSLYEIERKTTIQLVCESLLKIKGAEIVFVIHVDDQKKYSLDSVLRLLVPDAKVVISEGKTRGAACSCLLAYDYFDMDEPLIIVGGDQLVTIDLQKVIDQFVNNDFDGGVIIFNDIHPRWSYVKLDEDDHVIEAAEKCPISNNATTGFYYFKKTKYFVESAFKMIKKGASVNGNYYVCPVYNEMVLENQKIGVYRIDKTQYFNFNSIEGIELCKKYLIDQKI